MNIPRYGLASSFNWGPSMSSLTFKSYQSRLCLFFLGRFTVDRNGKIDLQPDRIASLASDPAEVQLRGKTRVTRRDFARAIRRLVEE